ncbi:hypothetical protein IQ249_06450 [Lusitaniella coriacea LEGE 07157]|uniref:Uncharacterized protein n=1 Tax=Lusitaniella coriacea LEGE 07157 TaxID=945747 RepID=A0A8J7DV43_9CYAN|nr:hypothetical protein [Lusitaniella coriacea]MBE9115536.1 hypothetical protein [Lusitaniella coriacea LEGE 07157]
MLEHIRWLIPLFEGVGRSPAIVVNSQLVWTGKGFGSSTLFPFIHLSGNISISEQLNPKRENASFRVF